MTDKDAVELIENYREMLKKTFDEDYIIEALEMALMLSKKQFLQNL